eukprot:6713093-Alexandrium_andersonii.AAC.1
MQRMRRAPSGLGRESGAASHMSPGTRCVPLAQVLSAEHRRTAREIGKARELCRGTCDLKPFSG